jgi:hypothetical protein
MLSNLVMNGVSRRESAGRCRMKVPAEKASRAGMLISLVPMVAGAGLAQFPVGQHRRRSGHVEGHHRARQPRIAFRPRLSQG